MYESSLSVNLAGIKMANPLMAASGCYGYGLDYCRWVDPCDWGAIVLKGTTLRPRHGNPPPRLVETPSGMLNAIGLQNPGIDYFLKSIRPRLPELNCPVLINIAGETMDEYCQLAAILDSVPEVSGIELNISCPNVKRGGLSFGCEPEVAEELVCRVREIYHRPLVVKLSPEAGNLVSVATAAERAGADALSLINTLKGIVIDVHKRRPVLNNITGGLSGPALRPVAVRAVWEVAAAVSVPVIGMGGVMQAEDALEFILAGAGAVAIGTANFVNPAVAREIAGGLRQYLADNGFTHYRELIGAARGAGER